MYDYVASGLSFTRIIKGDLAEKPEIRYLIRNILSETVNALDANEHTLSFLFNAHTETRFGEIIKDNYSDLIKRTYTDSGGLQVITQGLEITEEFKDKVYKTQGKWSDLGMSFDEIPVGIVSGGRSSRLDTSNRYFDSKNFKEKALESAKNLKRHIEVFDEMKTSTKPLLIAQGNNLATYVEWVDIIMNYLPTDYHDMIGGMAIGSAALGTSEMEDAKKTFFAVEILKNYAFKHIHYLGVGSVNRMLPPIIMNSTGLLPSDVVISYDSTTHTMGPHFGNYNAHFDNIGVQGKPIEHHVYHRIYDDILTNLPNSFKLDRQDFINTTRKNTSTVAEIEHLYLYHLGWILSSIINMSKEVNDIKNDKSLIRKVTNKKTEAAYHTLYSIRDAQDFNGWARANSTTLRTNPVKANKLNSLF